MSEDLNQPFNPDRRAFLKRLPALVGVFLAGLGITGCAPYVIGGPANEYLDMEKLTQFLTETKNSTVLEKLHEYRTITTRLCGRLQKLDDSEKVYPILQSPDGVLAFMLLYLLGNKSTESVDIENVLSGENNIDAYAWFNNIDDYSSYYQSINQSKIPADEYKEALLCTSVLVLARNPKLLKNMPIDLGEVNELHRYIATQNIGMNKAHIEELLRTYNQIDEQDFSKKTDAVGNKSVARQEKANLLEQTQTELVDYPDRFVNLSELGVETKNTGSILRKDIGERLALIDYHARKKGYKVVVTEAWKPKSMNHVCEGHYTASCADVIMVQIDPPHHLMPVGVKLFYDLSNQYGLYSEYELNTNSSRNREIYTRTGIDITRILTVGHATGEHFSVYSTTKSIS